MARPKSEDRRNAILEAATRAIVAQGLSAPTAAIAKEAGIPNGSLFTYFETKAELFNQLYFELKSDMGVAAFEGVAATGPLRNRLAHLWSNWTHWAVTAPEKRRAITLLHVSDDITPETRNALSKELAPIAALFEQARAKGPMKNASLTYVGAMVNAVAETTMDFMLQDPEHADTHCQVGFEALWRMLK